MALAAVGAKEVGGWVDQFLPSHYRNGRPQLSPKPRRPEPEGLVVGSFGTTTWTQRAPGDQVGGRMDRLAGHLPRPAAPIGRRGEEASTWQPP